MIFLKKKFFHTVEKAWFDLTYLMQCTNSIIFFFNANPKDHKLNLNTSKSPICTPDPSLRLLILMKHQSAHLNTLPRPLTLRLRVHKSRMRHPPRPPIQLRIKAFDQHDLLRRLAIRIVPLMLLVRANRVRLSASVGVDERHGDEI